MKKFSKIFETKEKILDVIGFDEVDIKDICQDLIDEYDFTFIEAQVDKLEMNIEILVEKGYGDPD
jgi:hypothetical protein